MADQLSNRMQRHHRNALVLAPFLMFLLCFATRPAVAAGPPDPLHSALPNHILLVGTALGVADAEDGAFNVYVGDADGLPCPGVTVTLDIAGAPDAQLAFPQPVVHYISCTKASAITGQDGRAFFVVVGGVTNKTRNWSLVSTGTLTAGTTLLGTVTVAAFDLDGVDGSRVNDYHLMQQPYFRGPPYPAVMDYDDNGALNVADFALSALNIFGERSVESQNLCVSVLQGPVQMPAHLEITKSSANCQGNQATGCGGTGRQYQVRVTSPVALAEITTMVLDLTVISPFGPLGAFWRFDEAGCNHGGLHVEVPPVGIESCFDGSTIFTDLVDPTVLIQMTGMQFPTYPAPNGDLGQERIQAAMVATPRYVGLGSDGSCTYGYGYLPASQSNLAFVLRIPTHPSTCANCATATEAQFRVNSITITTITHADGGYDMTPPSCPSPQGIGGDGNASGAEAWPSALAVEQAHTFVLVPDGSGSNIIWTDGSTVDVAPPASPASSLWLASAAPNPTSAGTLLSFGLPGSQSVQVAIVDIAGRTVRVLADGPLGAGEHRVGWDGTDASGARARPGVYYCRLVTGGERRSTAVVLTR